MTDDSIDGKPLFKQTRQRRSVDAWVLDQPPGAHHFHEGFSKTAVLQLSGGAKDD